MNKRLIAFGCFFSLFFAHGGQLRADVVDVGGPQPDFADIASAVVAAADGDVIRVFEGSYPFFTIDGRQLSVVGVGAVNVAGTVRVRNISADQNVLISGLTMSGVDSRGFFAHDNAGLVVVQDCTMAGAVVAVGDPWPAYEGGYALRCEQLVLIDSTSNGADGGTGSAPSSERGGGGFTACDSSVSAHGCTFVGGRGTEIYDSQGNFWGAIGGSAYRNIDSSLFAAGSTFEGGSGGSCGGDRDEGGGGGHALYANGQLSLLDNQYQPGQGGGNGFLCPAGPDGWIIFGVPVTTHFDGTLTRLAAPTVTGDAALVSLQLSGPPGHAVRLAAASGSGFRFLPGLSGVLHPDPAALELVDIAGSMDANGDLSYSLALSDLPPFGHVVWSTQAVVRDPASGTFTLSAPRWLVILDAAW